MSEMYIIFLTSGLTILGGIFIYTAGQIISKFFIEPIHEQARCIGEISYCLKFYRNICSNPGLSKPERMDEASRVLRQQASLLISRTRVIKWYGFFEFLSLVPKKDAVEKASNNLIGLSNSGLDKGDSSDNKHFLKEIERLLNI